jgi:hypothetical protein
MPATTDISIESGFDLIFFAVLDDDGYALGGTGVCTAGSAAGSPALRLDGAQTVDLSNPQPEVLTALGDDVAMVSEQFESADLPAGALAGVLVGAGAGWYLTRRVRIGSKPPRASADPLDDRVLPQP